MELAWVGLNYLGIERNDHERGRHSVADIRLAYMPYSHSVGIPVCSAALVWPIIEKGLAGHPLLLVAVIFVQIVVTLVLVGVLAPRKPAVPSDARDVRRHVAPGMASSQS